LTNVLVTRVLSAVASSVPVAVVPTRTSTVAAFWASWLTPDRVAAVAVAVAGRVVVVITGIVNDAVATEVAVTVGDLVRWLMLQLLMKVCCSY